MFEQSPLKVIRSEYWCCEYLLYSDAKFQLGLRVVAPSVARGKTLSAPCSRPWTPMVESPEVTIDHVIRERGCETSGWSKRGVVAVDLGLLVPSDPSHDVYEREI
jgi:hypothetical protein